MEKTLDGFESAPGKDAEGGLGERLVYSMVSQSEMKPLETKRANIFPRENFLSKSFLPLFLFPLLSFLFFSRTSHPPKMAFESGAVTTAKQCLESECNSKTIQKGMPASVSKIFMLPSSPFLWQKRATSRDDATSAALNFTHIFASFKLGARRNR